ncbi:MAG: hypothetical protein ABIQ31_14825 [Ferruginibacter sp.]
MLQTILILKIDKNIILAKTLIADGLHDKDFETQDPVVDKTNVVDDKLLRRGCFAALLIPFQY